MVGSTTLPINPLSVPGDCEQPEVPEEETPPSTEDTTPTTVATGAAAVIPRFTG